MGPELHGKPGFERAPRVNRDNQRILLSKYRNLELYAPP
jgi:hypothetical protein